VGELDVSGEEGEGGGGRGRESGHGEGYEGGEERRRDGVGKSDRATERQSDSLGVCGRTGTAALPDGRVSFGTLGISFQGTRGRAARSWGWPCGNPDTSIDPA
jgi:hypothetical protein